MKLLFSLLLVPSVLTLTIKSNFETSIQYATTKKEYKCHTYRDPHVNNFKGQNFGDYHKGWSTIFNDGGNIKVKVYQAPTPAWGKFVSVQRFKVIDGKKKSEFKYDRCRKSAKGSLSSGSKTYTMKNVKLSWSFSCGSSNSPMINLVIKFTTDAAGMKKASGICTYSKAQLKEFGLHREDIQKLHDLAKISETPKLMSKAVKHCGGKETMKHLGCMWDFVVKWRKLEQMAHGSTNPELYKHALHKCKKIRDMNKRATCMHEYILPKVKYTKMTFHAKHKQCHPLAYYWSKKAKDLLKQSKQNDMLSHAYDKKSSKHALMAVKLEKEARNTAKKALKQLQNRQKDYKKFSADLHKKHNITEHSSSLPTPKPRSSSSSSSSYSSSTSLLELGASATEVSSHFRRWNWGSHFRKNRCWWNTYSSFYPLVDSYGNYFSSGYWSNYGGKKELDKRWHTMVNFEGFALQAYTSSHSVTTTNRQKSSGHGSPWGPSSYVHAMKLRITEGEKVYLVEADGFDAHLDVNGKRWSKYKSSYNYPVPGSRALFPNFTMTSKGSKSGYDSFKFESKTGVIVYLRLYKYYAGNHAGYYFPYWEQVDIRFNSKAKKNVAKSHGVFGMCAHRYPWQGATLALDKAGVMAKPESMPVLAACRKAGFHSKDRSRSSKMVKCVTKGKGIFNMPKTAKAMKICDFKTTFDRRCVKKVAQQLQSGKYQSQDIGNHKCHDVGYHHWKRSQQLLKVAADYRLLIKKSIGKTLQYRRTVKTLRDQAKLQAKYASDYFKKRAADYGGMANDLKKLHKIADKKL